MEGPFDDIDFCRQKQESSLRLRNLNMDSLGSQIFDYLEEPLDTDGEGGTKINEDSSQKSSKSYENYDSIKIEEFSEIKNHAIYEKAHLVKDTLSEGNESRNLEESTWLNWRFEILYI